jgi:hypothetical protein
MPHDWGPHYIMPSEVLKTYSGQVLLREYYDEDLLAKELGELNIFGNIVRVDNPWYYRKKGTQTWIKIGESSNKSENFAVRWDTTGIPNSKYEVLGLMHVSVSKDGGENVIARQNIVEVNVKN